MRKVHRSALVPHSAAEMFSLVADVESYPEFLPWCTGAVIHEANDDIVEATLEMTKSGLTKSFTTRNTLQRPQSIGLALVGGPFRHLQGGWRFQALGDDGCKVSLELEFEFQSRMTDMLFGQVFEDICNALIDAFTRRAAEIYGGSD